MEEDINKWDRFKSGDKSALSEIYFEHFDAMFQYGMRFKNDSEFIKDTIQEVFIKIIQAKERLNSTTNIRYYLLKALKNAILKELTKSNKMEYFEDYPMKFEGVFSLEEEMADNENATRREKMLCDALGSLSARQREIIYLRYECGMEYEQICDIMKLKNDSARKLVFRAISSLKSLLEGKVDFLTVFLLSLFFR
jgi:RNA polymerase sigma factor (sigma-70 family)